MKLLFVYINPTGRSAMPPNITMLLGYLKRKSRHEAEVFDTSFYSFDFGKPVVPSPWIPSYFLPTDEDRKVDFPQRDTNIHDDLKAQIASYKPDLIAFSCYSNQYSIACDLLHNVKKCFPEIPTILGGCHASFSPETVISNPDIDMICVGEGEEALLELCNAIDSKTDYSTVKNLWTKKDGAVIKNPVREPTDLDEIGIPDWEAFDPLHIHQKFHGGTFRFGMVEFGRGCPYKCTYCANASYLDLYKGFKKSYFRHRDPKLFIENLKVLKEKHALELIYFQDGTFLTMPDDVLAELAELYAREINLPCIILTTCTTINEERLNLLNKMNCIFMNLGIEAGNPDFRKNVLKRFMTDEQIIRAFRMAREHKIYTAAYLVIGFPYETRDHVFDTIRLTRTCNPDCIYPQVFYPINGCELTETCLEQGFFDPANDSVYSELIDVGHVSILEGMPLQREEIHGLLRTFFLYTKMPEELFDTIRSLETESPLAHEIVNGLTTYYRKQEPHFRAAADLKYSEPDNSVGL